MPNLILADDHHVLRSALCEMLEKKGTHRVVSQVADGAQLLSTLSTTKADLIIMDIEMPNLDGIAALEKLAQNGNQVPVLVLSADEGARNIRSALKAGAKGYLPKNANSEELEFAIQSILQGKTYLSPSVTDKLMTAEGNPSVDGENPLNVLSKRELEILTHLADGKPNRDIGKLLHISTRTVDTHRSNILKKLKVRTNAELVKLAIAYNLISV